MFYTASKPIMISCNLLGQGSYHRGCGATFHTEHASSCVACGTNSVNESSSCPHRGIGGIHGAAGTETALILFPVWMALNSCFPNADNSLSYQYSKRRAKHSKVLVRELRCSASPSHDQEAAVQGSQMYSTINDDTNIRWCQRI